MGASAGCIFCSIVVGSAPSETVYADEHAVAFMDINPATEGHTLVVSRAHHKDLWEIPEEDAREVMAAAVRVASMIRRAFAPDGINIMHATGVAAFQSVFHFHLHVVPRRLGDPIRQPFVPRPGDRGAVAAAAEKIRAAAGA